MTMPIHPDTFHRLMKHAVDSGAEVTFENAEKRFLGYQLAIEVDAAYADKLPYQAAILTLAVLSTRIFLGGVTVSGALDTPIKTTYAYGQNLGEVLLCLGMRIGDTAGKAPTIVVGARSDSQAGFCVRTAIGGWRAGVLPIDAAVEPAAGPDMPLAGVLAAALAINAAYAYVSGERPAVHRETAGLSLWSPDTNTDWLEADATEPPLSFLPSKLWLIGLGHLGQAYLWSLGLLPYKDPADVIIGLQDTDVITPSTHSTSVLSTLDMVGRRKTRAMAEWAEAIGFTSLICDRSFDTSFTRTAEEPSVALCGVDNAAARRALDKAGFDIVIEAGLGRGFQDFRKLRIHTLPSSRTAREIWPNLPNTQNTGQVSAYRNLVEKRILDQCGMTLLANKAVGAPFVGVAASCLVVGEILRLLHGQSRSSQIDLDLLSLDQRSVLMTEQLLNSFNPGYAMCRVP